MNENQCILPVRIYNIPCNQISDLCNLLLIDKNVQNQTDLIRIITLSPQNSFVATIAYTESYPQYECKLEHFTRGQATMKQLNYFFDKFQFDTTIQQQFLFTKQLQSIIQQMQETPYFIPLQFNVDIIYFYKINIVNQNAINLVKQILNETQYQIRLVYCIDSDGSLVLAIGIDSINIQDFEQKLKKQCEIDQQWVNETMKEMISYKTYVQLNEDFTQLLQANPTQFTQDICITIDNQLFEIQQDDTQPCVLIQTNSQFVDPNELCTCLLHLNQVQLNQQLIKQVQIGYFFYFSLLIKIDLEECNQIQQQVKNFNQSCIIYNKQIPINAEQLQIEVGHKNVDKFKYSCDEVQLGQSLQKNKNYEQIQNYLKLQFVFAPTSLNVNQINQVLKRNLIQYSMKQYQNYFGITSIIQKSRQFWEMIANDLNTNEFCILDMSKQFFQNNFELYKQLLSNQVLPQYSNIDYRNSLQYNTINTIMKQSQKLKMSEAVINNSSNIIVFDFEFFFPTKLTITPYEVGVLRIGNGQILASYQAFLIPDQRITQHLRNDEFEKYQRVLSEQLNVNMTRSPIYHDLQPINIQKFLDELFIFMEGSTHQMITKINHKHLQIFVENIGFQKPDYFISKGVDAEQKAFNSIGQTFISENMQEFKNIIQSVKKEYKQPDPEQIHNQQMDQHMCMYHQTAGNHCALNDVINLGAIIIAEVFKQ